MSDDRYPQMVGRANRPAPSIQDLIRAGFLPAVGVRPTKSLTLPLQQLGRGKLPMPTASERIAEIQAELADLGAMQEEGLAMALARALREAQTVASPDSAARPSIRNEAARLALILEREILPFQQIMEKGQ